MHETIAGDNDGAVDAAPPLSYGLELLPILQNIGPAEVERGDFSGKIARRKTNVVQKGRAPSLPTAIAVAV
jgi:hypothetical protein